jgi:hypothetical protein
MLGTATAIVGVATLANICPSQKLLWGGILSAIGAALIVWRWRAPYCYLVADPDDLRLNERGGRIRLWLIATGYIENMRFNISPWDANPGYNAYYRSLGDKRSAERSEVNAGCTMAELEVPIFDWLVEYTARDNAWKQRLGIVKRPDGSVYQEPVTIYPDAKFFWVVDKIRPVHNSPEEFTKKWRALRDRDDVL